MNRTSSLVLIGLTTSCLTSLLVFAETVIFLGRGCVNAQVTSDGTLSTSVTQSGNTFTIDLGNRSGNNLFHSFGQFSVPTGGAVIFNNAPDIQNIFSHITGGVVSNIDGVIQANGTANLFLLNPSGILFGPSAALNIGGSFIGTTADSIKFADGVEFSVVNPTASPLLTISVPIGLQMGQNPGTIVNQGAMLQVPSGNTLALVGGAITQTGGELRVAGGGSRIEIASLGENNQAKLQPTSGGWLVDSSGVNAFRDILLTEAAQVRVSGVTSGTIQLAGANVLLENGSKLWSLNEGDRPGGDIVVNATTALNLHKNSSFEITTQDAGNSGNLTLVAPSIRFIDHSGFGIVVASGTGSAGNASLTAEFVEIQDYAGFGNYTVGAGNSGDVTIKAQRMVVGGESGGGLFTAGTGNAGKYNLLVDDFYMDGSSGFSIGSYGQGIGGNGADLNMKSRSIIIRDDSGFNSDTNNSGTGGTLTFVANYIELDNTQINSRSQGTGSAGNINVSTNTLRLLNGGQLNVSTKAPGNGGNIVINAKSVELNGTTTTGTLATKNTGILSSVLPDPTQDPTRPNIQTGNGGNIDLTSSSLVIRDGALISASTSAGTGNGGNIALQVDTLDAFNGGQIMSITRSRGNAGTITINARDRISLSGSDVLYAERQLAYLPGGKDYYDVEYNIGPLSGIYANATTTASGSGGNLHIRGRELRIQDGATVTVSSQGTGAAGNLMVNLNTLHLDQQASLQAESAAGSNGNLFLDVNQTLILRRGSAITTNATGSANGGNITINAPIILGLENSDIVANALQGRGGNIQITTQGILGLKYRDRLTPENDITASSEFGVDGSVDIITPGINPNAGLITLPVELVDPSQQLAQGCTSQRGSSFVISGRGGMIESPIRPLISDRPWADLRLLPTGHDAVAQTPSVASPPSPLVEATNWRRNRDGQMELFAASSIATAQTALPATCVEER